MRRTCSAIGRLGMASAGARRAQTRLFASPPRTAGNIYTQRHLNNSTTGSPAAARHEERSPNNPEIEFNLWAEHTLDSFQMAIESALDDPERDGEEDFDVTYADGILTIDLDSRGTFVLNKQGPNRQIWLSSPVSGPKRYDFQRKGEDGGAWINSRDGHDLAEFLEGELRALTGIESLTLEVPDELDS